MIDDKKVLFTEMENCIKSLIILNLKHDNSLKKIAIKLDKKTFYLCKSKKFKRFRNGSPILVKNYSLIYNNNDIDNKLIIFDHSNRKIFIKTVVRKIGISSENLLILQKVLIDNI